MGEGASPPLFYEKQMRQEPCVILIGMPGAGKSAIGRILASEIGYAFLDTDYLLESVYARRLQDIADALSCEEFRDAESEMIRAIQASSCVIATGGSAVYRPEAIAHLRKLGPLVHLKASLEAIRERVALNPERGISFGECQKLEDLYAERMGLYKSCCNLEVDTSSQSAEECASEIIAKLGIVAKTGVEEES